MVRHTLATLGPKVLASRMLRDYVTELYAPAGQSARAVSANGDAGAKELAVWRQRVSQAWPQLRSPTSMRQAWAIRLRSAAPCGYGPSSRWARLNPSDVQVQALYGRVDDADEITGGATVALQPVSADEGELDGGGVAYEADVPLAKTGAFGYAVRVLPYHPLLASPVELGLMAVPGTRLDGEAPPSW